MIVWLGKALILAIHERQVAEHGGPQGVRDDALLESTLARPQPLYAYGDPPPDLAETATAIAHGLSRTHPFLDGNKRTAAVACETFLNLNQVGLIADDAELYPQFLALAEGRLEAGDLAVWLRTRCVIETPDDRVQKPRATYRIGWQGIRGGCRVQLVGRCGGAE